MFHLDVHTGERVGRRFAGPADFRGRAGFTLVELLVTGGIISVLLMIILPVVGSVREAARSVTCLSNLRQLGIAALAYSTKYNGFTVPGYADDSTVVAANDTHYADAENWATVLVNEKLLSAPEVSGINGPINPSPSVFHCPNGTDDFLVSQFSDANGSAPYPKDRRDLLACRPLRTKSKRTGVVVDTWYGINATINFFKTVRTPCRRIPDDDTISGPKKKWDWSLTKLHDIKDPPTTVFLFDGIFMNLHYDADRISARHGRGTKTNILFFDGHAEACATEDLPGGMGPNDTMVDMFIQPQLGTKTQLVWRTNQK